MFSLDISRSLLKENQCLFFDTTKVHGWQTLLMVHVGTVSHCALYNFREVPHSHTHPNHRGSCFCLSRGCSKINCFEILAHDLSQCPSLTRKKCRRSNNSWLLSLHICNGKFRSYFIKLPIGIFTVGCCVCTIAQLESVWVEVQFRLRIMTCLWVGGAAAIRRRAEGKHNLTWCLLEYQSFQDQLSYGQQFYVLLFLHCGIFKSKQLAVKSWLPTCFWRNPRSTFALVPHSKWSMFDTQ